MADDRRERDGRVDFILNIMIVVCTVVAVGYYFVSGPDQLGSTGAGCFKYFTTDSNILAALASAVYLPYCLKRIKDPGAEIPAAVVLLKFTGTVAATLTLITVCFFLAPMGASRGGLRVFLMYFKGNTFALHFSTPVLAIISAVFTGSGDTAGISRIRSLAGMLPTVIYSLVYLVMVVILGVWRDWYGFTFGGKTWVVPVVLLVMYGVSYGIGAAIRTAAAAYEKRK